RAVPEDCPPSRKSASGSSGRASASEVRGRRIGGDAAEPADVDGLQLSGADERVARGPSDTEAGGGRFDGREDKGVVDGDGGLGRVQGADLLRLAAVRAAGPC